MSDERIISVLLASSVVAGVGALVTMKEPTDLPGVWYEVAWPREVDEGGVIAFLRSVAGDRRRHVVVFEAVGRGGSVSYRLGLSERLATNTLAALRSFVPGVVTKLIEHDVVIAPTYAWEMTISSRSRSLRVAEPELTARALITTLATTKPSETIVLQWLLGPRLAPSRVGTSVTRPTESWNDVLRAITSGTSELSSEERKALLAKIGDAGFRAVGRIGIAGTNEATAQALASRMLTALRQSEAPGVQIGLKRSKSRRIASAVPDRKWSVSINIGELAGLTAWPLGDGNYPGIPKAGSTLLRSTQSPVRSAAS